MKLLQGLPFVHLTDRADLPPLPGVYIAATADELLYVGQSGNMRDRWIDHHKIDGLAGFSGVRLYYLVAPHGFCGQLEAALIRQLAPLLNERGGEPPLSSSDTRSVSAHCFWGQAKTAKLPVQRMTPTGLRLLKEKSTLCGLSISNFLECVARGIEPSPEGIEAYAKGGSLVSR